MTQLCYVVFCRIADIASMSNDALGWAVATLRGVVIDEVRNHSLSRDDLAHGSVYGRFVLVPRFAKTALQIADAIQHNCARQGLKLAIGVSSGDAEEWNDLQSPNFAGSVINSAARLAFLKGSDAKIAVEEKVHRVAGDQFQPNEFLGPKSGRVKKTDLTFYWFRGQYIVANPPPTAGTASIQRATDHIVVYDIEGFSGLSRDAMIDQVTNLAKSVRSALAAAGRHVDNLNLWYQPAGDGGVLVFRSDAPGGRSPVCTFATALRSRSDVPIRIGIHTGEVIVLEDELPVGKGILEADGVSGGAARGGICASERFHSELGQDDAKVLAAGNYRVEPSPTAAVNLASTTAKGEQPSLRKPTQYFACPDETWAVPAFSSRQFSKGFAEAVYADGHVRSFQVLTDDSKLLYLPLPAVKDGKRSVRYADLVFAARLSGRTAEGHRSLLNDLGIEVM